MGKKTLLVFGTGADQIPGIRRAKEMDIYLVGLDANPYSRGVSLVDEFYPVSIKHMKEVEAFLQSYKSRSIDGVIAFGVDIPDILARASEILGVNYYTTYKLASISKDKYFAKELMKDYNVNLPEYESIAHFSDLKKAVNKFGYPCVLKPVDNSGARGVLRLAKGVDLKWAYEFSRSYSGSRRLIVEKFLQGVQLSTESFIVDGKPYTVGLSERNYEYLDRFSPFIIENGGDLPPFSVSREIISAIDAEIKKSAKAFGVENGVIKGDIVVSAGKVYVIEVALRLSGGHFSSMEIPLNTDIDFLGNSIKLALGERIDSASLVYDSKRFVSLRYLFPDRTGIIDEIRFPEWMDEHPNVYSYGLYYRRGDSVVYPVRNHTERLGYFLVFADDSRGTVDDLISYVYRDTILRVS